VLLLLFLLGVLPPAQVEVVDQTESAGGAVRKWRPSTSRFPTLWVERRSRMVVRTLANARGHGFGREAGVVDHAHHTGHPCHQALDQI